VTEGVDDIGELGLEDVWAIAAASDPKVSVPATARLKAIFECFISDSLILFGLIRAEMSVNSYLPYEFFSTIQRYPTLTH